MYLFTSASLGVRYAYTHTTLRTILDMLLLFKLCISNHNFNSTSFFLFKYHVFMSKCLLRLDYWMFQPKIWFLFWILGVEVMCEFEVALCSAKQTSELERDWRTCQTDCELYIWFMSIYLFIILFMNMHY